MAVDTCLCMPAVGSGRGSCGWLYIMYGVYKGSTVAMRDCVGCLGGVMDKLRYIFFYMAMFRRCAWASQVSVDWFSSEPIEYSYLEANVVRLTGAIEYSYLGVIVVRLTGAID